jgi:hypothetical protein
MSGVIYAITRDGNLLWYKDLANDGKESWASASGHVIGRGGWTGFQGVLAAH